MEKHKKIKPASPAVMRMLRTHKQVLLFNDKEMEAVAQFCARYKIQSKSRFFREAIMAAIFRRMEEDHPRLF